jgi:hypothetical protein
MLLFGVDKKIVFALLFQLVGFSLTRMPLGAEPFIEKLELLLDRKIKLQKPGVPPEN